VAAQLRRTKKRLPFGTALDPAQPE